MSAELACLLFFDVMDKMMKFESTGFELSFFYNFFGQIYTICNIAGDSNANTKSRFYIGSNPPR